MERIRQHYMIEMKEGECHPIFSLAYLAENIASFVGTIIISLEYLFILFFLINTLFFVFEKNAMDFVPILIINGFSIDFFKFFGAESNLINNLIISILTIYLYVLTYRYFEYIKYNLHPKN